VAKLIYDPRTSEYMTSYKYLVGMHQFRTKAEAEEWIEQQTYGPKV